MTDTTDKRDLASQIDEATRAVRVQSERLEELQPGKASGAGMGLAHFMDVPVQLTVEVGRTTMTLAELVQLGPGSLVELDREAHEPTDVLVNGKVVARGEIVTIKESYGIRITSIVKN
jgi:flagellar motor switch protein FliN/FliY